MSELSLLLPRKVSLRLQWLAGCHVYSIAVMAGISTGLMSPFFIKLLSPESPFEATEEQITWITSLLFLIRPLGSITGTASTILIGSKQAIHMCGVCFFVGWICLIFAKCIEVVFLSLLCSGLGIGIIYSILPIYIGEIADPSICGGLMSFALDGYPMGVLLGNIMGAYCDLWSVGVICLVPTSLYIVSFSLFPHTPYYFIHCNNIDRATESIEWYNRGNSIEQLKQLLKYIKDSPPLSFCKTLSQINNPVNRSALIRINIVYSFLQFSGILMILEYMEELFVKAQVSIVAPSWMVIILSTIGIFAGWATYTTDKFNRKTLILCACIAMSCACMVWGLCYQLLDAGFQESNLQWLAIIAAIIYRVCIVINLMPTITTMTIEMLSPNIQNVGNCICCINSAVGSFVISKYFQFMVDHLTYKYIFYLLAGFILMLAIYVQIFIPETKGRTLQEMETMLNHDIQPQESDALLRNKEFRITLFGSIAAVNNDSPTVVK